MADLEGSAFRLEFAAQPEFISTARLFAAAVARHFGCDEDDVQDVKVGISEACTNAVKAHLDSVVSEPIAVVVRPAESRLEFNVVDSGGGFSGDRAKPVSSDLDTHGESGIGIHIIRALFPDAAVANVNGGTSVRFSVKRDL